MAETKTEWYIVKTADGPCQIVQANDIDDDTDQSRWGPFGSQSEAIARRVGLIRAGKCQPV